MEFYPENQNAPPKNYSFVQKLYEVLAKDATSNVWFSPINIHSLLSAIVPGASDTTAQILNNILQVPDPETVANEYRGVLNELKSIKDANLVMKNKLRTPVDVEISEKFASNVQKNFNIEIEAEREQGNSSSPNNSDLVLVSNVSFESDWLYEFDSDPSTSGEIFHVSENEQIKVEMLRVRCYLETKFDRELNFHLVQIPYKNQEQLKMVILLPFDKNGISELEEKLIGTDLNEVLGGTMPFINDVWLPRFKIEETLNLSGPLSKMGLGLLFDKNRSNLSGIVKQNVRNKEIVLTEILQNVSLEVTGKGLEPNPRCPTPYESCIDLGPADFKVDHPAIFFVVAKHKNPEWGNDIILCGKLCRPSV